MVLIKWKILTEPPFSIILLCPREEEIKGLLKTGVGENSFHQISHPESLIGWGLAFVGIGNCSVGTEAVVGPNQCKDIMGSPALLREQCESKHGRFAPVKSHEQMKAGGCLTVGLLILITWAWGRGMTLRSAEFLWPLFLPLYHRHLGIDMKNERVSLLIMTVYHAVKLQSVLSPYRLCQ